MSANTQIGSRRHGGPTKNLDIKIDSPADLAPNYTVMIMSTSNTIACNGHVDAGAGHVFSVNNVNGYVNAHVDAPTGDTLASVPDCVTWTIASLPCAAGLRTVQAKTIYDDQVADQSSPVDIIALPRIHYVSISGVGTGSNCTAANPCYCSNAEVANFQLDYDTTTGAWKGTLNPGAGVNQSYKYASLSISAGGATGYVQFWIRKSGMGSPLMTFINSSWNYTYPISLVSYQDNANCDWSSATVTIST